jgi:hypothetical protein
MQHRIVIEDHVVPQLFTSAIEAYEIEHRTHVKGKSKTAIETYGLLWGYVLPARNNQGTRIICTMSTVETSAIRHEDWVEPNLESLAMKRDFFKKYWPHIELVGTFHSHPYKGLKDVSRVQGWRASDADRMHWPQIHERLSQETPLMAHLIITIAALEKRGWAAPKKLPQAEANTGFVLSCDNRKLWIKAYASSRNESSSGVAFSCQEDALLDIPALIQRFN